LKSGGAFLPIDPGEPAERLSFMIQESGTRILVTQEGGVPSGASLPSVCIDSRGNPEVLDRPVVRRPAELPLGIPPCTADLAYVIYTSGSTGKPKEAMNTHEGIINRILWMQREYALGPTDSVLQKTPFTFDVSVWEFFWTLSAGARLVIARPEGHKDS